MAKKRYIIDHLDCANCAAKIEDKFNAHPAVTEATITFSTKQLQLTAEDPDALIPELIEIARTVESNVIILPRDRAHQPVHQEPHHNCDCGHEHHEHHECGCSHDHHEHHECSCGHHQHDDKTIEPVIVKEKQNSGRFTEEIRRRVDHADDQSDGNDDVFPQRITIHVIPPTRKIPKKQAGFLPFYERKKKRQSPSFCNR